MGTLHTSLLRRIGITAGAFALALLLSTHIGRAQCPELIVNGDFEAGNTGFTTGYTLYNNVTMLYPQGVYAVTGLANTLHGCFLNGDHSGSGMQLAVNGATVPNVVVWSQTVTVEPGANYDFECYVQSHCGAASPASLILMINGFQIGASHLAPLSAGPWNLMARSWASGANTSATLQIINLNTAPSGNDFGLDDISFIKVDETGPTVITASPSMWPPNHSYHTFTLSQLVSSVSDDCDEAPELVITGAHSDELEDALGGGDGATLDDIVIAPDCQSVQLRAERKGGGNGRVYTVHITAYDISGNSTMTTATVSVPHNANGSAVDDGAGAGYSVGSACGMPKLRVDAQPAGFSLEQNYPNPFNPSTTLEYSLPVDGIATLRVYDVHGTLVATLADGMQDAGRYRVTFTADGLATGLYFARLEFNGMRMQRTMQLVK